MQKTTQALVALVDAMRADGYELKGCAAAIAFLIRDGADLLHCDDDDDAMDAEFIALAMDTAARELGA